MNGQDEEQSLLPGARSGQEKDIRRTIRQHLNSKAGHYAVLLLVSVDVTSIFVDFILQLFTCEGHISAKEGKLASEILGYISLVFSCLFMLELVVSVWATGGREYFQSWFRCFDALVIVAGFVIDVLLKGVLEEIGSIVIVLRLWRVFKIMEELSTGAEEQSESMEEEISLLKEKNGALQHELNALRQQQH